MENNEINNKGEIKNAYFFTAPMILFAVIFVLLPVAGTFVTGFFRDISFLSKEFIGLDNYRKLFSDIHFWHSFRFTVLFVIVSVSIEIVLGLMFAVLLNEKFRLRGLARTAILIPWAIPVAVSARAWQLIYNYNYGVFNYFLLRIGIINEPVNWLGSAQSAFFSLVISDVWKATPFVAIILLAGLSAIPEDLYNQAKIDGASFHQRFFKITLPLLKPVIVVALLFRTIDRSEEHTSELQPHSFNSYAVHCLKKKK